MFSAAGDNVPCPDLDLSLHVSLPPGDGPGRAKPTTFQGPLSLTACWEGPGARRKGHSATSPRRLTCGALLQGREAGRVQTGGAIPLRGPPGLSRPARTPLPWDPEEVT